MNKIIFAVIFLFVMFLYIIYMMIGFKMLFDRKKSAPFECGFDAMESSRKPFSIRFFSILIIFLIFDVELIILLGSSLSKNYSSLMSWTVSLIVFMLILMLGLVAEWHNGLLNWF